MTAASYSEAAPVDPGAPTPGGDRSNPTIRKQKGSTMLQPPTDNPYPVDSATRRCCGVIGGHARDCGYSADAALQLDGAVNLVDLARADANNALRMMPADVPLFAVVDVVAALGHLRQAAVLIDRAADQLDATAQDGEVRR